MKQRQDSGQYINGMQLQAHGIEQKFKHIKQVIFGHTTIGMTQEYQQTPISANKLITNMI